MSSAENIFQGSKRFDGHPTPADLEKFYAPYTSVTPGEAEAIAGKFKDTVVGDAIVALLGTQPTGFRVEDMMGELGKHLHRFPERVSVIVSRTLDGRNAYPDGIFSWSVFHEDEIIDNGGYTFDENNQWRHEGSQLPQEIKEAAYAAKKHIEDLVPGFKDSTPLDEAEVVFLPGLKDGEYVLEQLMEEWVGTMTEQPGYEVSLPQLGEFRFYQFSAIKGERKSDLLLLQVVDMRDGEGNGKRMYPQEGAKQYWLMPDIPAIPNERFHRMPQGTTRYADSVYRYKNRVIYAPVPPELQKYFQ